MTLTSVISDNLQAAGYDPGTRTLRVAFRGGGVYDYLNVDPTLARQVFLPHPWRRIGRVLKAHRSRRVG